MKVTLIIKLLLPLALFLPHWAESAKILFFFGLSGYSHRVSIQPLVEALAERGHRVSIFSSSKLPNRNESIRELFPDFYDRKAPRPFGGGLTTLASRLEDKYYDPFLLGNNVYEMNLPAQRDLVEDPAFQQWAQTSQYDLILFSAIGKDIALALAYKMGAKTISYMPAGTLWMSDFEMHALPIETSWCPDNTLGSRYPLIPDRWVYAYHQLQWYFSLKSYYFPKIDELVQILFAEDAQKFPGTEEMARNVSLMFYNQHFSTGFPQAFPPYVIPVGGMHVQESGGTLPEDLEKFIASKSRFVFISFGSVIKVTELPDAMHTLFFQTLASFQDTNFLWKWEGEIPRTLPQNVLARNWFPQDDLLAHGKCKGFVSQGGQMSLQQAAFHAIPVIVIPVWADQAFNGRALAHQGMGIHLELSEITQQTLGIALDSILNNPEYSKAAKDISRRFRDRPLAPLASAVWWVEYALRHDLAHLKSPGLQQYWWQRRLLDFYFVAIFLPIMSILYLCWKALKSVFTHCCNQFVRFQDRKNKSKLA